MRRLLVIIIGLFSFMAISPAFSPAMAENAVLAPEDRISIVERASPEFEQHLKLSPRIASCRSASMQQPTPFCLLKGAIVEPDPGRTSKSTREAFALLARIDAPFLLHADGPLKPPQAATRA